MRWCILAFALAGCATDYETVPVQVADAARAQLLVTQGDARIVFADPHRCAVLDAGATAMVGGLPATVEPGDLFHGEDGYVGCDPPRLLFDPALASMTAPDAAFQLVLGDGSGQATASVVGLFAKRTATASAFAVGQSADVQWSPATDQLVEASPNNYPYPGSAVACSPPSAGFGQEAFVVSTRPPSSQPTWGQLALDGNRAHFIVPATSYTGPLACQLQTDANAEMPDCTGFASCTAAIDVTAIDFTAAL